MRFSHNCRSMFFGLQINGTILKRRAAASSTLFSRGAWLPTAVSLKRGMKVKKSPRM